MKQIISLSIYIHAILGGIAMVSGIIPIATKKGSRIHVIGGKVFYYSLLASCIISLFVAINPGHKSPFLFSIGIFTIYMLVGGKRAIRYKEKGISLYIDKFISTIMAIVGIAMVCLPLAILGSVNVVLLVFGILGILACAWDFYLIHNPDLLRTKWLSLHIGKIVGAYIASVSAFMVVNQFLPGLWNWFGASIIGSIYISYWINKVNPKKTKPIINNTALKLKP